MPTQQTAIPTPCETVVTTSRSSSTRWDQASPLAKLSTSIRKLGSLVCAAICLLLGVLGVILPGLPATPFFLLASHFLLRHFPRLNAMLLRSRLVGGLLTDWQVGGGIRPEVKRSAILTVVVVIGFTLYFQRDSLWYSIVLLGLATVGLTVICRLPTLSRSTGQLPPVEPIDR